MKACNRDLLVLVKDEHMNEKSMERELEQLNDLLFHFETIETFCTAHEVFDINKHKRCPLAGEHLCRDLSNA